MNGFNKFYQQHKEHYDVSFATPIAFPKPRKEPRAEELIYQPTIIEFSEALLSFWLGTIGGNNNHMRPRTAPHDPAAYPYLPGNWKNPLSDPPASRGISISRATHEEVKAQRKKMQPIYYANIMANLRAEPIRLANYAKRWARNCARMTARRKVDPKLRDHNNTWQREYRIKMATSSAPTTAPAMTRTATWSAPATTSTTPRMRSTSRAASVRTAPLTRTRSTRRLATRHLR